MKYKWTISSVDVAPKNGELTKVIKTAHWRLTGTDDDGLTAEIYGAQGFAEPDPASYTPYEAVTESDVISWIQDSMGEDEVENRYNGLDRAIDELRNPKIVSGPPPWVISDPRTTPELVEEPGIIASSEPITEPTN